MPKVLIYHITHINNLPSIIREGGLWCEAKRSDRNLNCLSIAYMALKERRGRTAVPCGKGGVLSSYVPFYFAPRSPMLYVINHGKVDVYRGGQRPILHLVSTVEGVQNAGLPYVFTDGHAVMALSQFFEDKKDLRYIDWGLMKARQWNDTPADPDRMRRRQAEFLAYDFFPWELVVGIGVMHQRIASQVDSIISNVSHQPIVRVKESWYY